MQRSKTKLSLFSSTLNQDKEKMSCTRVPLCLLVMIMAGCVKVSSDFAQDKTECQDQLIGLSPCVPFISEKEKSPAPVCCLQLAKNFDQKRKCMCMLVRDRNDPGVGFKVNATLALSLPLICHIPANETQCLGNQTDPYIISSF